MSTLLHRLGRFSAMHHWLVIAAWAVIIAVAATAAVVFSKPLTNEFDIPGSRFQVVLEELKTEIPEAAGASGTVVFHSPDGFTESDRQEIAELVQDWQSVDGVAQAIDPFAAQQEIDGTAAQLAAAAEELAAGRAQLDSAREELDAGAAELEDGWAQWQAGAEQLEAGRDQLPPEALEAAEAQLAEGEQQLQAAQDELDAGRAELDAAAAELDAGEAELALGERMAALTGELRLVSSDGTVALAQVVFVEDASRLDPAVAAAVTDAGDAWASASAIEVYYSQSLVQDLSGIMGPGEVIGLAVAAIVLFVMLGTLLAAGLPLLMALVGVSVGLAGAMAVTALVDMNTATPALALMLGLAVGIDYSLFLINRHRTQLRSGMPVTDSIALATGTSGNAVTFAGMTVIIALAALSATGIPFLAIMGLVAAATVLCAVLVSVTLTPAMLALMGRRVLPAKDGRHRRPRPRHAGWAARVQRHPITATLVVLALAGAAAYPALQVRLGLPDGASEPAESTAYQAYDLTREAFGAGANGPIIAMASLEEAPATEAEVLVAQVELGEELAAVDGVVTVVPFGVSEDLATLAFQLVPQDGPAHESTQELVESLQDEAAAIGDRHGAELGFTGQTVANIDISAQLADALPLYLALVIGLSLVLLVVVFRSVLVPLLATAGFLVTLVAAFGAVVVVYQWGWLGGIFDVHEPGPILAFLPTLLVGVLFGLAMDYQLFLVTAMREAKVHGESARDAVVSGFNHSARVVTAAAIIMISVFGGFVFAHLAMIRPVGFGLAIGVLVDAFLVRMTLTPAVLSLLDERAWWIPRWLDRILPEVDVEGTSLERQFGLPTIHADGSVDEPDQESEELTPANA